MEEEDIFPFETSMGVFLHSNCTSTEQVCILLRSHVGVNDNKVQPEVGGDDSNDATTQRAAAREEFAKLTKMRQRQETKAWSASRASNLTGAGHCDTITFFKEKCLPVYCLARFSLVFLSVVFCVFSPSCPQIAKAGTKGDMSYLYAPDA